MAVSLEGISPSLYKALESPQIIRKLDQSIVAIFAKGVIISKDDKGSGFSIIFRPEHPLTKKFLPEYKANIVSMSTTKTVEQFDQFYRTKYQNLSRLIIANEKLDEAKGLREESKREAVNADMKINNSQAEIERLQARIAQLELQRALSRQEAKSPAPAVSK